MRGLAAAANLRAHRSGTANVQGLAVEANLLFTHWLAHRVLRPVVSRLLANLQFRLPDNAWLVTMISRLTPRGALAMFAGTLLLMHERTVRRRAQAQLAPLT